MRWWWPSRCQGGGRGTQRPLYNLRPLISDPALTPAQELCSRMDLGYQQYNEGDWSDVSISKSCCGSLVSRFAVHKLLVWTTFWRGQNYSIGCPHCVFSPDNLLAAFSGIWLKGQNMLLQRQLWFKLMNKCGLAYKKHCFQKQHNMRCLVKCTIVFNFSMKFHLPSLLCLWSQH